MRRHAARTGLLRGIGLAVLLVGWTVATAAGGPAGSGQHRVRDPDGQPVFLIGASYQGPADRAWRGEYWAGWADDRFDGELVSADFERAAAVGLNTLRVFVQRELLKDLRQDVWWKLDTILELAERHGLLLIITFGDYDEPRVGEVARVSAALARRYAGHPAILAYDLRNEPDFWTLQTTRYPDGQRPPLLSRDLVEAYGERAARHFVDAFRASEEGRKGPIAIPDWFSDDEAYYYHNNWLLSYELAREASAWAQAHGLSDVDYFASLEAGRWTTFLRALDETFDAWLEPQLRELRAADPTKPITVGHHDPQLAHLPANRRLDFLSSHRYPPPGLAGIAEHRATLRALRSRFPDKPIVLGEFGHRTTEIGEGGAAIEETAVLLELIADDFAGGLKWMLTDTRSGTDTMGIFRTDGSPKPLAAALAHVAHYATANPERSAQLRLEEGTQGDLCYTFRSDLALFVGGSCSAPPDVGLSADGPSQLFLSWSGPESAEVTATVPAAVRIRPAGLFGSRGGPDWVLETDGGAGVRLPERGGTVEFWADGGRRYRLRR